MIVYVLSTWWPNHTGTVQEDSLQDLEKIGESRDTRTLKSRMKRLTSESPLPLKLRWIWEGKAIRDLMFHWILETEYGHQPQTNRAIATGLPNPYEWYSGGATMDLVYGGWTNPEALKPHGITITSYADLPD